MKKEDFISMGIDPELAEKAANASIEELKGYIPKNRFDEVNSRVKTLETDVKSRDDQLEQLKKVDADALQQTIKDLQQQNKNMQTQHGSKKISPMTLPAALTLCQTFLLRWLNTRTGLTRKPCLQC